jgi:hypothetical protein
VTTTPLHDPEDQRHMIPPQHGHPGQDRDLPDALKAVREFNAANQEHERLWMRARRAADAVRHASNEKSQAWKTAREAQQAHLAVVAEYVHRHAPLLRQAVFAAFIIALDAVACWFAAQALGSGQTETLLWTGLFLAVLGGGEVALDYYSDRNPKAWRLVLAGLSGFIGGLGVLRFLYLATVGAVDVGAAAVGAVLFTVTTAGFVVIGYRALRAAETFAAWRARRQALRTAREAKVAGDRLARSVADRNRLIDAYLSLIRVSLLDRCTLDQLPRMEAVLRLHLCGSDRS